MNSEAKRARKQHQHKPPGETHEGPTPAGALTLQNESISAIDPRLWELVLDGASSLEAFIWSRIARVPYAALRDSLRVDGKERAETIEAAQAIAYHHREWLQEHGGLALFLATWTALQIEKLDAMLQSEPEPPADAREARGQLAWGLFLTFLPLLIFGSIFILSEWRKEK